VLLSGPFSSGPPPNPAGPFPSTGLSSDCCVSSQEHHSTITIRNKSAADISRMKSHPGRKDTLEYGITGTRDATRRHRAGNRTNMDEFCA
jgi:hypothetical protein